MKANLPARRLIPKWRPVATTLKTAEALSIEKRVSELLPADPEELGKAISLWRETQAPGALGEVLSFSVHPELVDIVRDVGREAVRSGAPLGLIQQSLINDLWRGDQAIELVTDPTTDRVVGTHPFQTQINRLRSLLRSNPSNPLALLDYAQLQAALGKTRAAERSILTALSLAPNNRTVLRTAARYYVHADNAGLGHHLIRKHRRTADDPWLLASEIALADAANVDSVFLAKGKRFLLEQKKFSSAHVTELAGVIAYQELRSGNLKKARESQRKALLSPNDNVVAHAVDFENNFGIKLDSPEVLNAISRSSEALVLRAWVEMEPEVVESQSLVWHDQEPFSSRPIQMLSTLLLFRGDSSQAMRWLKAGLLTDPKDRGLLINLAFAQACQSKLSEAGATIRRLRSLYPDAEPFVRATEGLIEYARGNFDLGDQFYDGAMEIFKKRNTPEVATYCRVNQALMAIERTHPKVMEIVEKANQAIRERPSFDSLMLLKTSMRKELPPVRPLELEQRRLSQWVFDPSANTLTNVPGVTAIGAKAIVVLDKGRT
ncbi:MAG: hypothetical protein Q8M93_07240 [Polaromonas sp.]|uniref:tetratricopeptide repeat protein n=1 Tax=Polaromonas sp. TaxID=1869339 RepID=UPI002730B779|nr:hypothetical protein [Polaromonas sp.]MDP2448015.1 hypothetical protein [Polaromonas sp.]MDP3246743.1 hypothetical protein [Polaromonas sp.]MDP3756382.1 hypothetical protein [Polaromonas sp.]